MENKDIQVIKVKGFVDNLLGMIKYKNPIPLFFISRFGIHTIGMRYPIDVLILDNKYRVKVIKKELKPNKFMFWNPKFKYIIELPSGYINQENIQHNTLINLKSK